jgi:hypothetical protein
MGDMQASFGQWVQVAVNYQISEKSQADLDSAATAVTQGLAKAQTDLGAVLAAS